MHIDGHHEQVKNALIAALRLIDAGHAPAEYHLGPSEVFPCHDYRKQYFAATEVPLWHAVRAGLTPVEFIMGCGYEHNAEYFVLAATEYSETVLERDLGVTDLQYTSLQNRLLDDMEQAIVDGPSRTGHPLQGHASDGEVLVNTVDFREINRNFLANGWCCLEVRLELNYFTPRNS